MLEYLTCSKVGKKTLDEGTVGDERKVATPNDSPLAMEECPKMVSIQARMENTREPSMKRMEKRLPTFKIGGRAASPLRGAPVEDSGGGGAGGGLTRNPQSRRCPPGGKSLPTPVYFLVREQAKSLVAIRELQDRIRHLEESQGSIFEVVSELQVDFGRALLSKNLSPPNAAKAFARPRFNSDMDNGGKKNYSKGTDESTDNKQDSGVDSDCQAQLSVSNVSQPKSVLENPSAIVYEQDDELLVLLDLISQRGAKLRQKVDEFEDQMSRPEQLETLSYQDVASLLSKCRGLQKRLKEAYSERDHLRSQLDLYESVVGSFREEKRRLEEKLDSTVHEKKQLESRLHRLHGQFIRGVQQDTWELETPKTAKELEKAKRLKRRSLDENKMKISEVLKEKSSLELQRQLLHMILENESMAQTLAQSEEQRLGAAGEWEKRELRMRLEIENLVKEKAELNRSLGHSKIENTDVLAKVKLLERALQAVSQDTKIANQQLENTSASLQKRRASAATFSQMVKAKTLGSGHVFQSLPSGITGTPPHSQVVYVENEIHPFVNTSGYLNISLDEPELEALERENPELDFRKCLPTNRSSTPVNGNASKLELKSGQTRSYHSEHADLNSICSEFDPLSQITEGKTMRVAEFVDSLDALPSNNIMFVPVSVAKVSLRSDKPKYFAPLVQRVSYPNVIQRSSSGVQYPVQSLYHQMAASVDAGLL